MTEPLEPHKKIHKPRLIAVVLDGLRYDTARDCLGYMEHLMEKRMASVYKVISELPSLSRPLYEVLLTGRPVYESGITGNHTVRLSSASSLFHLAKEAGMTTAAAAYHWVSELYNRAPFQPASDRHVHDRELPIQHGCFYFADHYPDSHLFADGEYLRRAYDPDFLYIHPMNIDDAGHKFGGESKEYEGAVRMADQILSMLVPLWMQEGYTILVTSDHGMTASGQHGGVRPSEREVPLYLIGAGLCTEGPVPQLAIAPLMAKLLELPVPELMRSDLLPELRREVSLE